jgi:hypothetical protein
MRPQYRGFLTLSAVLLFAIPVVADELAPGRYLLSASPSGFVRLDTVTGATSHCRQQDGAWRCEPLLAAGDATNERLEALSREVTRLSAALAALNARVAALASVNRENVAAPVLESPPMTRYKGFAAQLVKRFLDVVRTLKHGRDGSA